MRHHHTGSGRRPVIPTDWQEHHAAVIGQTMEATITIADPSVSIRTFDDTTGLTGTTAAAAIYSGPAAVAMVSDPRFLDVVDQPSTTSLYQVALPLAVEGIKPGFVVHVVVSPDPMLVGRDLTVNGAQLGDRRFSRVLHATLNT